MELAEIQQRLEAALKPKRYVHSVNVMNTSVELAQRYGADRDEAALAGLLHDCARGLENSELIAVCEKYGIIKDEVLMRQPLLLHGKAGAFMARDVYGVTNLRVLKAIESHTMGNPGMDTLACVVFLADYIEPARSFPGVEEIRAEAYRDLHKAMLLGIDGTIRSILDKGGLLHADIIATRNWLISLKA